MQLLTRAQTAEYFGVSLQTLWRWTKTIPEFPKPVMVSPDTPRWLASDLEAYIANRKTPQGAA